MLDRSLLRARELAIRASVGGSRRRLLRQLLVEGLVIAGFGAGIGRFVAIGGVRVFRRAIPADALPDWFDYLDWRVLTALTASRRPRSSCSRSSRPSRHPDRRPHRPEGGRTFGRRRPQAGVATMFLAAQLALAVVLLAHLAVNVRPIGQGRPPTPSSTIRKSSLRRLRCRPPRTRRRRHLHSTTAARAPSRCEQPGSAAIASTLPASGGEPREVVIDGKRGPDQGDEQTTLAIAITPRAFRALGLALLQGRELQDQDEPRS